MPQHSMAVRRWSALRSVAAFAALCVLAGCRFDVAPDSFARSADVGDTATEILTVTNTGDEPVELTLAVHGAAVALSASAATLQVTEAIEIEISAECEAAGERRTVIAVTGRTRNKAATVEVPFLLRCVSDTGMYPISLEVFQGPPIYKKDFVTGTETTPIPMALPEDGSPAVTPLPWGLTLEEEHHALRAGWSADDNGFVTAVWRRQAAVAVTVRHLDDSPVPEISATIERDGVLTALPQIYQETERGDDAYLSDTVFYVERGLYDRGAELEVSVKLDGGIITERLDLFGEEVLPLQVTWIPIVRDDLPDEEPVDPEEWTRHGVLGMWPVGDYKTGPGPTMTYQLTEDERIGNAPYIDSFEVVNQLIDHRALNACGGGEMYVGVFNNYAAEQAGLITQGFASAAYTNQALLVSSPRERGGVVEARASWRNVHDVTAHEMGHMFGLGHHAPCGGGGYIDEDFPYDEARLGPARSWDFFDSQFAGRAGERGVDLPAAYHPFQHEGPDYADVMSYCLVPGYASDYNYQLALLHRQSTEHWDMTEYWAEVAQDEAGQDSCTPASTKPASSGIVAKSAQVDEAPSSIAITGAFDADGIAAVRMVEPTTMPPWPAPGGGNLALVVLDAGGYELHRQPVRSSPLSHSDGRQVWSARIPYFEDAVTVVLLGPDGDLRASALMDR